MNNFNIIANTINQWHNPFVEEAIFGTGNAADIAEQLNTFCTAHLGSPISNILFYESSQGAVSGLLLSDGRRVVLKAHQPDRPLAFLSAVYTVQHYLADHNYPCPSPLLAPTPIGNGHATVEELMDTGIYADAHNPSIRRIMAAKLARLASFTPDIGNTPGLHPATLGRQLPTRQPSRSFGTTWKPVP